MMVPVTSLRNVISVAEDSREKEVLKGALGRTLRIQREDREE